MPALSPHCIRQVLLLISVFYQFSVLVSLLACIGPCSGYTYMRSVFNVVAASASGREIDWIRLTFSVSNWKAGITRSVAFYFGVRICVPKLPVTQSNRTCTPYWVSYGDRATCPCSRTPKVPLVQTRARPWEALGLVNARTNRPMEGPKAKSVVRTLWSAHQLRDPSRKSGRCLDGVGVMVHLLLRVLR